MKTIRNNTFETNSSSCHVLTVADQAEYDLVKNNQAVIYVPVYHSQSEDVYESVILTKEGFLSVIEKQVGEQYEAYSTFFEESWNIMFMPGYYDDQLEELAVKYKVPCDIKQKVEDIIWHSTHEEGQIEILNDAIKKEVNGSTVYVSCWSKYC